MSSPRSGNDLSLRSRRQHKAWGASPRIAIKESKRAREAGDSSKPLRLSPASRAQRLLELHTWGLRPRLYAVACFAGSALILP